MPNLLQSSQTQATTAPGYFNTYLSDLATQGTNAARDANYVGATPLQQQAFSQTDSAASAFQPTLTAAGNTLTSAGDMTSPLASAQGYLNSATQSPAELAQSYMNPYISSAVQRMSDIGQRNISQNLSPLATASAVGSGQFGSKRGAQVLGQVMSNAENDLNNQIGQQLSTGYGQALSAAGQRNQTLAQVGSTAGNLASQGQQNLTNLGKTQADLASQNQELNLKRINALSTMGEQERTLAQNKQLFPLQNMSTLSSLLRGYSVPTTTTTTAEQSPLSAIAGAAAGTAGFMTPRLNSAGVAIPGTSPFDILKKTFGFGSAPTTPSATTEVANTANPGQEGYGWRNFTDGTSIDPQGNYYKNGELIYSPGSSNTTTTDNTTTDNTNTDNTTVDDWWS